MCKALEKSCREGELSPNREKNVCIVWGNLITLLAVRESLGKVADSLVLLLEEEKLRWFEEIYHPPGDPDWWYSLHCWKVVEFQEAYSDDKELIEKNYPKPDGFEYWVLNTVFIWGELAGGCESNLWKWDGTKAEPIELFNSTIF